MARADRSAVRADLARGVGAWCERPTVWTRDATARPPAGARVVRRARRSAASEARPRRRYGERLVVGPEHERWEVREVDAGGVPGARGERCLIFENHAAVRRLWEYPADWLTLSDAALLALGRIES